MTQGNTFAVINQCWLSQLGWGWQKKKKKKMISSQHICSAERQNGSSHFEELSSEVSKGTQESSSNSKNCVLSVIENSQPPSQLYLIAWFSIFRSGTHKEKGLCDKIKSSGLRSPFWSLQTRTCWDEIVRWLESGRFSWVIGILMFCWFLVLKVLIYTVTVFVTDITSWLPERKRT